MPAVKGRNPTAALALCACALWLASCGKKPQQKSEGEQAPGPGAAPAPANPARATPPKGWRQYDYPASGMRAYFPSEPKALQTTYGSDGAPPGVEVPPLDNAYTYNTRGTGGPDGVVAVIEVARYKGPIKAPMRDLVLGPTYRERGQGRKLRWLGGEAVETAKGKSVTRTAILDRVVIDATILRLDGPLAPEVAAGFFDNIELTR